MKKQKKEYVSVIENDSDNLNSSVKSSKHQTPKKSTCDYSSDRCDHLKRSEPEAEYESENEPLSVKSPLETGDLECSITNLNNKKPVSINSTFSIEELTSDDEIYIFRCPEHYTKQNLCGRNLDFTSSKQSITSNNELYELEFLNSNKETITVAFPKKTSSGVLTVLPLKGHIVIQKVVDVPICKLQNEKHVMGKPKTIFPEDLKVRHPLLGIEWKDYIDHANESIRKVKSLKKKKHKKLKKEKTFENLMLEPKKLKRESSHTEFFSPIKKEKITYD